MAAQRGTGPEFMTAFCPTCAMLRGREYHGSGGEVKYGFGDKPRQHFGLLQRSSGRAGLETVRPIVPEEAPDLFLAVKRQLIEGVRFWMDQGWLTAEEIAGTVAPPPPLPGTAEVARLRQDLLAMMDPAAEARSIQRVREMMEKQDMASRTDIAGMDDLVASVELFRQVVATGWKGRSVLLYLDDRKVAYGHVLDSIRRLEPAV